ncbi:MAG: HD domain-containing phosphohydrolase [Halanaerobiales bacterium]
MEQDYINAKFEGKICKKAKEKQEEMQYQFLFNKINDAIYLSEYKDGQFGKFEMVNNQSCQMLNYSREELMTMNAADIDYNLTEQEGDNLINLFNDKKDVTHESVHVTKEGVKIPVEVNSHLYELKGKIYVLSIVRDISRRKKAEENYIKDLIISITYILEMYDIYTSGHSRNVAEISTEIAQKMGLKKQKMDDIYWAGMVHDIGKLLIPLDIINKKGRLTDTEYELIKKHPVWGYMALNKSRYLIHIPGVVRHHHERWDGKGYPDGLKGDQIPLASQILALADAYEAMTSERPYRCAMSHRSAVREIISNTGTQFSPEVVDVFLELNKSTDLEC